MAGRALKELTPGSIAFKEAALRKKKPIDYLRCAEFPLAYEQLTLRKGMSVLDVASPQWFSLCLAYWNPEIRFIYCNILDVELDQIRQTAEVLGLKNIEYRKEDCRAFSFADNLFDRIIAISVIEHIAPDVGGDVESLREIYRVLKKDGELVMTVPFKDTASLVYDDVHPVWEKAAQEHNFYMRNYDMAQFEKLAGDTRFAVRQKLRMFERQGLFSMEYWEIGPGKHRKEKNRIIKLKKKIDKLIGLKMEGFLADRYLRTESKASSGDRLVNLVATLTKV